MEWALSITTLAISRAGALALSELCAWGVPAILVPLPHAAADHQRHNARALEAAGAAIVLEEATTSQDPGRLWLGLVRLLNEPWDLDAMAEASRARGNPRAADDIAADLWRLMEDR
jgi:UDP-N-acetylglucosamine--N-acetylmuramyl-(pentapeptide) pyrophosphoryl-undecaprenol N-acetylglucosamine transferase